MRNNDLIDGYLDGMSGGTNWTKNLKIVGPALISYSTIIAFRTREGLMVNITKYSPTASKHQNRLLRLGKNIIEVSENEIKEAARDV